MGASSENEDIALVREDVYFNFADFSTVRAEIKNSLSETCSSARH